MLAHIFPTPTNPDRGRHEVCDSLPLTHTTALPQTSILAAQEEKEVEVDGAGRDVVVMEEGSPARFGVRDMKRARANAPRTVQEALERSFRVNRGSTPASHGALKTTFMPPTPTTLIAFHRMLWDNERDDASSLLLALDGNRRTSMLAGVRAPPLASAAYQSLRARMTSLLRWPALLTTVPIRPLPADEG